MLEGSDQVRLHFTKAHGLLVVLEILQVTRSRELIAILLRIMNLVRLESSYQLKECS